MTKRSIIVGATGMVGGYAAAVRGTPQRTGPVLENGDIRAMIASLQ